jgi:biotin operon repressor
VSRSARLLSLSQALRGRRYPVTAAELARTLEVSERTIYRDVAQLAAQGAPIQGEGGVGYVLRPGLFLPRLMLSEDETEAVLLGLRYVDQCGDEILMQAATSALAKISSVLSPGVQSVLTAPTTLAFRGYVSRRAVQRHSRSHPVRQWTGVTKRLGTRCALLRHDKARAGSDLFPNGYLGCMTCRSFRSLQLRVSSGLLLLSSSHHPVLQLVEVDIDDRRRIEGQNLRHGEAAYDGVA